LTQASENAYSNLLGGDELLGDRCFVTKLERWGHIAGIVQAAATTAALVLGAWWFLEQRQTYPHAEIQQTVDVVPIQAGLIAVEVQIQFENIGKRRIHLTSARIKLQSVSGEPYDYPFLATLDGAAYWRATRPVGPNPEHFNQGELRWPLLKQYDGAIDYRVEPGEKDTLVFTFLLQCAPNPGRPLGKLRVASDILKPDESGDRGFAWKARTFVDASDACKRKG